MQQKIINNNLDNINHTIKYARTGNPRNGIAYFIVESNKLIDFINSTARQIENITGQPLNLPVQ